MQTYIHQLLDFCHGIIWNPVAEKTFEYSPLGSPNRNTGTLQYMP